MGNVKALLTRKTAMMGGGYIQSRLSLKEGSQTEIAGCTDRPLALICPWFTPGLHFRGVCSPVGYCSHLRHLLKPSVPSRAAWTSRKTGHAPDTLFTCAYDTALLLYCKVLSRQWGLFHTYVSILSTTLQFHIHKYVQVPKTGGIWDIFIEIMNKATNK